MAAPTWCSTSHHVCLRRGTYTENVVVGKDKTNLVFVGDGSGLTKVTASRHSLEFTTPFTATICKFSL